MNVKRINACAAVLVCALIVSPAAFSSSVTYDYTGVITSVYDTQNYSIAVGSPVSGTYVFDFANGNPAQSSGTIGSANWTVVSQGGAAYSLPTPTSLVFASTAQVSNFGYSTPPPQTGVLSSSYVQSSVQGSANSGGPGSTFTASEGFAYSADAYGGSSFSISNPGGAYSVNGLPILAGATSATGAVTAAAGGLVTQIEFNITSLTPAPVPIPAAAWLLMSGLGGLAVFARKKPRGLN
jgi:hypothetical protein